MYILIYRFLLISFCSILYPALLFSQFCSHSKQFCNIIIHLVPSKLMIINSLVFVSKSSLFMFQKIQQFKQVFFHIKFHLIINYLYSYTCSIIFYPIHSRKSLSLGLDLDIEFIPPAILNYLP